MESKQSENFDIEDEEIDFQHTSRTAEDNEFDEIVGQLEQILMDDGFTNMQNEFCEKHCGIFVDAKENKIEYTTIFEQYTNLIESFIEQKLKSEIPGFTMKKMEQIISARQDELGGEVFELLTTLGDFTEFKDLMLSYKQSKTMPSLGLDFAISGKKV